MKKQKIKDKVEYILQTYPKTRDMNDREFYLRYLTEYHPEYYHSPIYIVYTCSVVPNPESVGRARRKAQENNPFLRPSKEVTLIRAREEEEWRAFAEGCPNV